MLNLGKYCYLLLLIKACFANTNLDDKLQQVITNARSKYNISAISLSISLPGQTKIANYTSGTVSKQDITPITPNNLFQIGSITKNFTAVLILQLVENKQLSLNDPLGKYLPEYPLWRSITIRQLLNHTSGLYDYIDTSNWWEYIAEHRDKVWQPQELLAIAYKHKPYFTPGNGWHYSNTNYVLAGLVIEKASGKSLEGQMQNLLKLANLNNSYYLPKPYPKNILEKMVHGYYQDFDQTTINGSWGHGAAALISTPSQVVIWVKELFNGSIISKQSLITMQKSVVLSSGRLTNNMENPTYGLGMFSMNTPAGVIWLTPGLTSGYRSLWVYMPCDGVIFAYSAANSLIGKNFHTYMLQNIIETLINSKAVKEQIEKYQQLSTIPTYCKTKPQKNWGFIKF
ncbi:MAG: hypothetical protein K0R14_1853 [Burkholderiales bacterium]|jgi:D-alanyl-D-alanine carboxypeptidase|nr:hypothetical protein [Burkholderiales bacterium]